MNKEVKMKTTKLVLSIGFIFCVSLVVADIINVPTDQSTIQYGINAASNGDTVLAQPGTYLENINYSGKNITVGSLFLTTHDTIYIATTIIDGNNANSVVKIESGENSTAVLCGFTITNGSGTYGAGGGINCYGSTPTFQYLLITANSADYGGGVWIYDASPTFENVTITDNVASADGGGISCSYGSNPVFKNSIHWNNSPPAIHNSTSTLNVTYSDFQGGITGVGNIDSDPLFVDPLSGNYHIQLTSPCLDAGDPVSPLDPDGSIADIGVFYFHYPIPPDADFTSDITTGNSPLTINFTDISTPGAGAIDEWYWVFGDGNFSTLQNPSNEYLLAGDYTVSLTVTDVNDSTDTKTKVDYLHLDPPPYYGPVWHISATTGSDITGTGSELYPFATIQYGINISSDTDTVLVQPGTYYENINFNGKLITVSSLFLTTQDTNYIYSTGIDGFYNGSVVTFNSGEDSTAELSGFTLAHGDAIDGGGIYCESSSPSIENLKLFLNNAYDGGGISCYDHANPALRNLVIMDNDADNGAGGILINNYSNPTLENITIGNNTADWGGGIYFNYYSSPSLTHVVLSDNVSIQGGGIFCNSSNPSLVNVSLIDNIATELAGGIFCYYYSNPSLNDILITGNTADTLGGGIFCAYASDPILKNVTIADNSTNWLGGGACIIGSDPTFEDVIISGNSADRGGGCYIEGSSPILENVSFIDNSATGPNGYGGGVYCYDYSNPTLQNVLIANNNALYGGGIFSYNADPTLDKVTITGNTASTEGGGVFNGVASDPVITNSILWNDIPEEINIVGGSVTVTYSDIEGGFTGTGNIDTDPLFANPSSDDYHLQAISPCIDAGDPDSQYFDPDGTVADMGAFYINQYNGPVWYVSETGSDETGSGWEQYPFATIQHGINISSNGDTVIVMPGTYKENINFNGKLITLGSLFLTTQDTTYISSTIIDGTSVGSVVSFISGEDSTSIITGFTIANGVAINGGGIRCINNSSPSLRYLIIRDNSADGYGGGVNCFNSSSPNLQNVVITDNHASNGGGIRCYNNSNPNMRNVTISDNSAVNNGGGIYTYESSPSISNVVIIGNSASYGGGISSNENSNISLVNVTISGNSASDNGGGIECWNNSNPGISNSILWNNTPQEIFLTTSSVEVTYSDVESGWAGTGNIDSDPLFVDPDNGDYHLQLASPCIDVGDPTFPFDPDGSISDMGAYYHPQFIDAEFVSDLTIGVFPLTVNFTDLSLPGTGLIDEWYWDFGDGNNSSLQNPTNEYFSIGYYPVSLTVTNDLDSTNTETKINYIKVTPPVYYGPVWHISTSGSNEWGNGSSQYPFATIQYGIDAAADTDTVIVHPGIYVENINFNGKLVTVGSNFLTTQDTSYISQTIIDGDSIASVVSFLNGEDSTAVLCGFTITNGYNDNHGGGIYCVSSNPTLQDLIIAGNYSDYHGGGIYCTSSNPNIQNVSIFDNKARFAGGIYCWESSPDLFNVIITDNTATSTASWYGGGGITLGSSHPNLVNVIISGNTTASSGGGISMDFSSNPTLQNVSIVKNTANYGGGIFCYEECLPNLLNVTISDNTALTNGGGIYSRTNSNPDLSNCILWNNSPEEIFTNYGGLTTTTYSNIEGGYAGTGNIDSDPIFADTGSGNYHLLSTSPCIDAGDPVSALDPDGTIADMGAFYFGQHFGSVWHVATSGSDLTGSGSEQNPFASIQHGIGISSNADTVLVHPGTFMENINFNGKLITIGSLYLTTQDTSYISSTIIDGNNSGSVVIFENGENGSAILKGLTVANGNEYSGGGISCDNSSPGLQNLILSDNFAVIGGGIYINNNAHPIIQYVTLSNNIATANGGGMNCNNNCFPTMINVTMSNNYANYGGGIFCLDSYPVFINSILWDDYPQEIYIGYGDVTVSYSDIDGGWPGTGNISSNPIFIDPVNRDFHLLYNSPCIDLGDPGSPLDPDGTIADMGAYYFHKYSGPVWHVSTSGSDITGNGSEQFPFATIQHGIDNAANTDTVLVQPGTYVENIDYGGKLITVGSLFLTTSFTSYISTTIIDGNSSGRVVSFSNGEDTTAVLSGFTLMNGYASGSFPDNGGGGIYCGGSSPTLRNLIITDNSANSGGGIFLESSSPIIHHITLSNNTISNHGGGLYCYNASNPILQNVIIAGNLAGYYGGGIMCYLNSSPTFRNVTISNNSSSSGGGIYCQAGSNPSLLNNILWENSPQEVYLASGGSITTAYSDIQGGWSGIGNIDSDPLFVNTATGDYHLQSGSPCIDAGDPATPLDPDGSIVEMGAYYFVNSELNLKVLLQGPTFNTTMNADLNAYDLIPSDQPYNISPWNYEGTESVTSVPANVVDWVLVELRDAPDANSATSSSAIDQQAAFLRNDGMLVDLDGITDVRINYPVNQQLFVVIRHRNHLDIMSANPLIETAGVYSYDFRIHNQAFGSNATIPFGNGAYGMYTGDANADGQIDEFDKSIWIIEAGGFDYLPSDLNLDSQSNNIDKNDLWWMNRGVDCQVPE